MLPWIYILVVIYMLTPLQLMAANDLILEKYLEKISEEDDSSEELERIENLRLNPIVLRTASYQAISSIPLIDYNTARRIAKWIDTIPKASYQKIQMQLDLNLEQMYFIKLCSVIETPLDYSINQIKADYRARSKVLLSKIRGFEEKKYIGNELDFYERLNLRLNNFSAGIMTNKDPGEVHLADFWGAYFMYEGTSTSIILGDYNLKSGMGTSFWESFGLRKGTGIVSPALQYKNEISPSQSAYESKKFRGFAINKELLFDSSSLVLNAFFSKIPRSGTLDSASQTISSIYQSGYYRTESEIEKEDAFREQIIGTSAEFISSNFRFGALFAHLNYNYELLTESKNAIEGDKSNVGSIFASYLFSNMQMNAEIAIDGKENLAYKFAFGHKAEDLQSTLSFRYFSENYRMPYSYNFGEYAIASNEAGVYFGLKWQIDNKRELSSYFDYFKTLGRTYFVPLPSYGSEFLLEYLEDFEDKSSIHLKYKLENKSDFLTDEKSRDKELFQFNKNILRADYEIPFSSNLKSRLRADFLHISFENYKENEQGYMLSSELKYDEKDTFMLSLRASYFDSDSYDSGIWQFSYYSQGYALTKAMSDNGLALFVSTKAKLTKNLKIQLSYSAITKFNKETLGSAYTETYSNFEHHFLIQLDFKI